MIYITGDTHGDWIPRLNSKAFPEGKEMELDDYVIICGDFGIWHDTPEERYNLNWLAQKPFTTLFVDGNHENFDRLYSMRESMWCGGKVHFIRPNIIHLMRGQVFTLESGLDRLTFFTFGGASSHDIQHGILDPEDPLIERKIKDLRAKGRNMYRVKHVSWWEEELPSEEEMLEGIRNLERHNNEVDYIVSHSPHSLLMALLSGGGYKCDKVTHYLQKVRSDIRFRQHFFGHMHTDENFPWEKAVGLYEQIIRIA